VSFVIPRNQLKLHNVMLQIFYYELLCIYAVSVQMIFVAKNK
jgi:hypothetical protein